jgi:hypothetical protein
LLIYQIMENLTNIHLLVCVAFVLSTKAFNNIQDNTKIANILAVIFSLWLYIHKYIYDFMYGLSDFGFNIIGILFSFYTTPLPSFGTFFVVGGIISKIYFSKHYGEIIIKFGIAFLIINALFEIFKLVFSYYDGLDIFVSVIPNVLIITFWSMYLKSLLLQKINFSIVPKNDPKDW